MLKGPRKPLELSPSDVGLGVFLLSRHCRLWTVAAGPLTAITRESIEHRLTSSVSVALSWNKRVIWL